MNAIAQSNQAEDPLRVPPPVYAERVHADRPAPAYPICLVTDASKLLIRLQKYDKLECAGTKQLEDFERISRFSGEASSWRVYKVKYKPLKYISKGNYVFLFEI